MKVIETVEAYRQMQPHFSGVVGLVPTMGALHAGHLELIKAARKECDHVVVSLFVNPTQFGQNEDLDKYPRPLEQDKRLAESEGVDVLFHPESREVYPQNLLTVRVEGVTEEFEGAKRPGHFNGVATVVAKLFQITNPQRAYFGLKDLQQCAVIRVLNRELFFPIELRFLETVRESTGLALSSRNAYFTKEQRLEAAFLYSNLHKLAETLRSQSDSEGVEIHLDQTTEALRRGGFNVEYLALVNPESFKRLSIPDKTSRLIVAATFYGVRLIDNIAVYD